MPNQELERWEERFLMQVGVMQKILMSMLRSAGYQVDSTPRVGSIAQHNRGSYGHVAVVEELTSDGKIVISESSYAPCSSSWNFLHRIRTVEVSEFENYIYVE